MGDQNSMYNWYKNLIEIKKMYPDDARLEFHSSSSQNVLVLKVTGGNQVLVIYINVGTGSSNYMMNPDDVAGGSTTNVKTMGGAPSNKGGDIGASQWAISVFKK